MENQEHLKNLFNKYLDDSCSEAEVNLLLDHFVLQNEEELLKKMIQGHLESQLTAHVEDEKKIESALLEVGGVLLAKLEESESEPVKIKWSTFYRIAAAAVVFLALSAGLYFYWGRYPITGNDLYSFNKANDIAPGRNMATLTLANGNRISLNDSKNGIVIDTGAVRYTSTNQTALSLQAITTKEELSVETPPGGTYQVILSDGTKIWLNAASSIKFQSSFSGLKDRRVELIGEAYFEVAKNKNHPFIVLSEGQEVEVLGTHFNINNYKDEGNVSTTLIEGRVRVTAGSGQSVDLLPAQQSVLTGKKIIVQQANVNEAVAWKNEQFLFDGTDFKSVMGQLARWYNVEVDTENLPDKEFNGLISRSVKLSEVLRALEMTSNVRFKIEGRRITIE